ncbi:hypothetical protein E2C01_064465 [Portunus trituberculatus]|uniref:Uncharacterized protein n=1 Tax=Portunus trituberculatus TaxID=210409 RepID=A0A5B7HJ56_PORTR|nr:hypothetical protein [Portunus trituberculatus]
MQQPVDLLKSALMRVFFKDHERGPRRASRYMTSLTSLTVFVPRDNLDSGQVLKWYSIVTILLACAMSDCHQCCRR